MKLSEVRNVLEKYSEDQLRVVIARLYRAIPKAIREEKDIDRIIADPEASIQSRNGNRQTAPDIEDLRDEADRFVEDAYNQYYFAPNRFVSKRDRPKWRFIVKRLCKDILASAADDNSMPEAAQLLEKLYRLLCYSCAYTLFSAHDSFESVGIEQKEFFRRVLTLKYQYEDRNAFIENALLLMVNNPLNRYTLHEDLMAVILEFAKTPDLKEMTIGHCSDLMETIRSKPLTPEERQWGYERTEKLNSLTKMAFLCYARLYEYANAVSYFKKNYCNDDEEVALYVMLRLLYGLNQKELFLQEYEKALANGVRPRASLRETYRFTKEKGELPASLL
ncbi:MAG: hypothetical protein HYY01_11780 [Chloroflexi bacterium]|nr:hypothetical protein [Chloroflexota bacterium]